MIWKLTLKRVKSEKPTPTRLDFIFLMSFGVLLAWSLVAGIVSTTVFSQDYGILFLQVVFATAVLGAVFSHKYLARAGLFLFVVFFIFFASGFLSIYDEPTFGGTFNRSIVGAIAFLSGEGPLTPAYESVILWTISIAFSLFVVLFCYRRFRFFVLFSVSSLTFGLLLSARVFHFPFSFHLFAFLMLTFLLRHLYQQNLKKFASSNAPTLKYLLPVPVVVATLFLTNLFPTPEVGFLESTVQNAVVQPFNYLNDLFRRTTIHGEFSLQQVGFSDTTSRLGGDISLNDGLFMRIRTNAPRPIYLTGLTRDTYTGYSWINNFDGDAPMDFSLVEQNLDAFEVMGVNVLWYIHFSEAIHHRRLVQVDANTLDPDYFWIPPEDTLIFMDPEDPERLLYVHLDVSHYTLDYLDRHETEIHVGHHRLTSVFHMDTVEDISSTRSSISFFRHQGGHFFTGSRMPRNSRYTVRSLPPISSTMFITPGGSHRYILSDMSAMLETFYQTHGTPLLQDLLHHNGIVISYEELLNNYLIPRTNEIYDIYTHLPEDFPVEVAELAREVTYDAFNDYHRMQMLEQYLRDNFPYTLTPGPSPTDQDFVYHFLFDIQEGYCVHFATAFVTMARSLGMPARYVEGFRVNDRPGDDGYIDVLNNMAHAWAEVYFEGYGWYRFEPTPASSQYINRNPSQNQPANNQQPTEEPTTPTTAPVTDDPDQPTEVATTAPVSPNDDPNQPTDQETSQFPFIWALIGLLILGSGYFLTSWIHQRRKGSTQKANKTAILNRFTLLFSQLKVLKLDHQDHETFHQFVDRISNELFKTMRNKQQLKQVADIFNKARYSEQPITGEEQEQVEVMIKRLDRKIKGSTSKWRYVIYRWRMRLK